MVISDLHVGDKGPLEDFVYEEAFMDFLDYLAGTGGPPQKNQQIELVVNGDFIEFLQVPPLGGRDLSSGVSKIKTVLTRHKKVFQKLGAFLAAGNQIRIIPGNHDLELNFPRVQGLIADAVAGTDRSLKERLLFHPTFFYLLPEVYIEHGHQYDSRNRVDLDHLIQDAVTQSLNLPWGSRFVIEIFNEIEARYGFIDNVKPLLAGALIVLILDKDLFLERVPRFLGLEVENLLGMLKRILWPEVRSLDARPERLKQFHGDPESRKFIEDLAYLSGEELLQLGASQEKRLLGEKLWDRAKLKILRQTLSLIQSTDQLWEQSNSDPNIGKAKEIMATRRVKWVVFGHTHGAKKVNVGDGTYLNTGTWTDLLQLPSSGEEQTLKAWLRQLEERTSYLNVSKLSFVQIEYENSVPKGELMIWKDGKAEVDPGQ